MFFMQEILASMPVFQESHTHFSLTGALQSRSEGLACGLLRLQAGARVRTATAGNRFETIRVTENASYETTAIMQS
jgi:hypothetical protein